MRMIPDSAVHSMDAIGFVLGVKSRHLRSAGMDELVYRGRILHTSKINADGTATDGAAPNGHVNGTNGTANDDENLVVSGQRNDPKTAWVMAVFQDDAGVEHRWKRTVTRSGSSEYRINEKVVSQTKYNEALESERILIKAKNFLVAQGAVEGVASQDAKDLTRMVEQISGSLEYKAEYEKFKAEKDQADTDQAIKLNERRAINSEIKQYQEQKRVADEFNAKVEERNQVKITRVLWKLYHCQRKIDEANEEITNLQEEHKEQRRNVQKYQALLEDAQREHAKAARDVAKVQKSIAKRVKETEDADVALVPVNEKLKDSTKHLDEYKAHMSKVVAKRDDVARDVEKLKKSLDTVKKAQKKWEDEWKKNAQKEGRELNEADLREYTKLRSDVTKQTAADQAALSGLSLQLRTDEDTVKSLKNQVDSSETHLAKYNNDLADMIERRQEIDASAKKTKESIAEKKQQNAEFRSIQTRMNQTLTEANEKLQTTLKEIYEFDGTRRENEKERQLKENIAAMKRVFDRAVYGRLSDLCKPKQKKYELAVSTILAKHLDSIVVDTNDTSRECIEFLRERRIGTMTFLPLDTLQVHNIDSNLKGMHRGMQLAIDTIEYGRDVERAMAYACGNSMICEDDEVAKFLIDKKSVQAKAVTLDGKIWHSGGKITGGRGQDDHRQAQRWDAQKYDRLCEQRDKYLKQCAEIKSKIRDDNDGLAMLGELRELEARLQHLQEELKANDRNIASKKKELAFVKSQLKEFKPKFTQHNNNLHHLKSKIDEHKAKIDQVADKVFGDFCGRLRYDNIRTYEAQQGSLEQEAREKKREFNQQRQKLETQLALDEQRLQDAQARVKNLENGFKREESTIAAQQDEKEAIEARRDELSAEIEELSSQLEAVEATKKEKDEIVAAQRQELQKRKKGLTKVIDAIEEYKKDIQTNSVDKFAILKKCKIDQVKIPLTEDSQPLESLPLDDIGPEADPMEIDGDPDASTIPNTEMKEYGIEPDYSDLDDDLKEVYQLRLRASH